MTPTRSRSSSTAEAWTGLALLAVILVPAAVALATVREIRPMVSVTPQPTPYGYTWGLLFFLVPVVTLGVWFHRHPKYREDRESFWISAGLLFLMGLFLDVVLGTRFFTYENAGATLGIPFPVIGGTVPIEELGFYSFGFLAILLTYIWMNEYWLGAYQSRKRRADRVKTLGQLASLDRGSLVLLIVLAAAGIAWKKLGPHPWHEGMPWYYLFLLAVGFGPSLLFFPVVKDAISWRALSFTVLLMILVSLLWEGVLAMPYQWWGFQNSEMLGIQINALSGLPIEEPILWIAVSYAGVTIYEVIRMRKGLYTEHAQGIEEASS